MKTYKIRFVGRKVGSIGSFEFITAERTAESFERAVKALYNEFEHISNPVTVGTSPATFNDMARQAIFTKYYGPTDTKGSKIKAYCERGSVFVSYPDELSGEAVRAYAVEQLLAKFAKEDGNDKSWGTIANYACGASPNTMKTIRENTLELLFNAEKAGRITGEERRAVTDLWAERDYYDSYRAKVRPGYPEREDRVNEIMQRLY